MYLSADDMEAGLLRQGDIISDLHLLGAINPGAIQYASLGADPENYVSWMIANPPSRGDAMVLSHSCEISPENGIKFTSVVLSPLRDVHKATDESKIEELISSNLIDQENPTASYLKYFYLPPNPLLQFSDGAIVDFSKCFSVRKNFYEKLVEQKIIQLDLASVPSMALKLALYFHRRGEEGIGAAKAQ